MNIIVVIFAMLAMLAVMLGANYYIFFRLWHLIPTFPASRILLACIAVFLAVAPFLSMGFGDRFPYHVSSFMYHVGTSWMKMMIYLVFIFFVLDMMRIAGFLSLERYMFNSWAGFGALFLFFAVVMIAGNINYRNIKRVELNLMIDKETNPLKIVAISDLHLGYGIDTKEFRRWVELINREEPDVVLMAGDIIDNSLKPLYDRNFADVFREIKSKYGVFLALGNHEYISNIEKSIEFFTKTDVTILRDTAVFVGNAFYVAGRDDRSSNPNRKTIAEIIDNVDNSKPIILIDHQPFYFDEVENNSIDLYIAGHTHKGQIFPITLITRAMFEVSHGYLKRGNSHFYVTSGIGIWGGKFRIGSRSEYVVINLTWSDSAL